MRLGLELGIGAIRGGSFLPTAIAGLTLWLRADTGITLNGSRVSGWADQSGHGNDGSQGTAAQQPLLVASAQNGRPVLRGDGARRVDISGQGTPTAATLIFVMSGMVAATDSYLMSAVANLTQGLIANYEGAQVVSWYNNGDIGNFGAMPTDRSLHVFIVTQVNGSSLIGYLDGAQVFSAVPAHDLLALGSIISGATLVAGGSDGDVAEVIAYDRVLAAGELASVTSYLKARYAIA